jgi:hypothetical protein
VYEYDVEAAEVWLISRGRTLSPRAHFAGASASGDDVFFWTREQLVGWDTDALTDIYDARVGGGLPEPEPGAAPCVQDCQGSPASRPALPSPGSRHNESRGDRSPGPRPSFTLSRLSSAQLARLARRGRGVLRVRVNRAGKLSLVADAALGGRRRVVGRSSERATKAGTVTIRLELSTAARRQLTRKRRLKVRVVVRFAGVREARALLLDLRRPGPLSSGGRS